MLNELKVLGIKINAITKIEALTKAKEFLYSNNQHTIFTPNPEIIVAAIKDREFINILNKSSLNICDGQGLAFAINLSRRYKKIERITGIDFMHDICRLAQTEKKSVYFLGSGDPYVIKKAANNLQKQFPKLKIVGFHDGPKINTEFIDKEINNTVVDDIIMSAPDILFVGFGHGKQEKWIYKHLSDLPSVKIAMGVGGAFDILGEKLKRAPRLMQKIGLEWLWRLILEPKRTKRIWTAVIIFPILVFLKRACSKIKL